MRRSAEGDRKALCSPPQRRNPLSHKRIARGSAHWQAFLRGESNLTMYFSSGRKVPKAPRAFPGGGRRGLHEPHHGHPVRPPVRAYRVADLAASSGQPRGRKCPSHEILTKRLCAPPFPGGAHHAIMPSARRASPAQGRRRAWVPQGFRGNPLRAGAATPRRAISPACTPPVETARSA